MAQSRQMVINVYVNFRLILIVNRIDTEEKVHIKDVLNPSDKSMSITP